MHSCAGRASLVLDLKGHDRPSVDLDSKLGADWMPAARTRGKHRDATGCQALNVDFIKQRLPLNLAGRAVEDDDSASVPAALEQNELMKEKLERFKIGDSRAAEVGRLAIDESEPSDQHLGDESGDVQVIRLELACG